MKNSKELKKELPGIKENVSLADYTIFKIGGETKYFYPAKNKEEFLKAVLLAKKLNIPFFILGGGSNLLVADSGFSGLVIKCQMSKLEFQTEAKTRNSKIYVESGTPLSLLVFETAKRELSGLEWGAGIPGTVGGAIKGNSGAFGDAIGNVTSKVEVFNSEKEKTETYSQKECQFAYRESVFKKRPKLIILSAELELKNRDKKQIKQTMEEYLDYRRKTQPLELPSAGSVFKNPPDVSAGQLIDHCGLKGKKINHAQISEKHANFIINLGKAKAADVIQLIELAKKEVKAKFNIQLEEEIQYLGF